MTEKNGQQQSVLLLESDLHSPWRQLFFLSNTITKSYYIGTIHNAITIPHKRHTFVHIKKKVCEASLCDPSANSISHSAPRQKVIFSLILLSLPVLQNFGSTHKIFRSEEKEVFPLMFVLPRLHCTGCHSGLNISLQRMKQHCCDSDYSFYKKENTTKPEKKMSDNCKASCCRLYMWIAHTENKYIVSGNLIRFSFKKYIESLKSLFFNKWLVKNTWCWGQC